MTVKLGNSWPREVKCSTRYTIRNPVISRILNASKFSDPFAWLFIYIKTMNRHYCFTSLTSSGPFKIKLPSMTSQFFISDRGVILSTVLPWQNWTVKKHLRIIGLLFFDCFCDSLSVVEPEQEEGRKWRRIPVWKMT